MIDWLIDWRNNQCDQIGRFLKVLGKNTCYKSSPNIKWHLGYFDTWHFLSNNFCVYFFGNFFKKMDEFLFQHLVTLGTMYGSLKINRGSLAGEVTDTKPTFSKKYFRYPITYMPL